ncbi:glutamine-hydrolyzing GMP synthase [Entomospira nematocerorum]|uniref:glutamine-hydrolyzing GMP synthase n=1 Tax=Entomospira nematocerorum TaxID=2719987 RepID=UPI001BAFC4AE|nr:glutamine-hydrolyzing GMP synthase [Entomospira nematocera]WDI33461.1 glutamine-hydrolyzing GMP synthase [Entomospira nematocera]
MNLNSQKNITPDGSVLIIDYGSQLTQLIAKRARSVGVYSEVVPYDTLWTEFNVDSYRAFIISGGPMSASDATAIPLPQTLLRTEKPMLFICYGAQRLAHELGGLVESSQKREYGSTVITLTVTDDPLFRQWPEESCVLMSHSDHIEVLPSDCMPLAYTNNGVLAAFKHNHKPYYAVQFHPEAEETVYGNALFENFLLTICGEGPNWSMQYYLEEEVKVIRQCVGDQLVLLGLSGGVDSLVSAAILHRAIGKQLYCVFVDHGLMRLHETQQVQSYVQEHFDFNFIQVDASQQFFSALEGIIDPEEKRKIVGKLFIDTFLQVATEQIHQHHVTFLAQGTIYSDVIESAHGGKSQLIKSHHNVGGLPEELSLQLIEPLRYLFKDEVRALGLALGIHRDLIMRHPFPGPGLTIRVLGEVKESYVKILQLADNLLIEELHTSGWYEKVSQAFCVFAPVKSVGVKGDNRSYEYTIVIRIIQSDDFMTGKFAKLPWDLLEKIGARIVNEVAHVSRVVYDITNKPPATVEWE